MNSLWLVVVFVLSYCAGALTGEPGGLHFMRGDNAILFDFFQGDSPETVAAQTSLHLSSLGLVLILVIAPMLLACRRSLRERFHACRILREKRDAGQRQFIEFPSLTRKASIIARNSDHFTGKTESLARALGQVMDELKQMEQCLNRRFHDADLEIHPASIWGRISTLFSTLPYRRAVDLLQSVPLSIDGMDRTAPFDRLLARAEEKEQHALELIEKINRGTSGLPGFLERSGNDLKEISRRLSYLCKESHKDGFFPLINLQTRLLPSTETLLAESCRIGATDPVSAMENPAKLAARQLSDALQITKVVEDLRRRSFPGFRKAVRGLQTASVSSNWVDQQLFDHSKTLETLAERAVLWSISEKLEFLSIDFKELNDRILGASVLANRIRKSTLPAITLMEKRIADQRREIGSIMGLDPAEMLLDGEYDPGLRVSKSRQALQLIRDSLARGNVHSVEGQFEEIDEILNEANDLLLVSNNVLDYGKSSWNTIATRIVRLQRNLPEVERALSNLTAKYPPEVLHLEERFGSVVSGQEPVSHGISEIGQKLSEIEWLLDHSREAFENGKLISAGRDIAAADSELNLAEYRMGLVVDQNRALSRAENENGKALGNLRWRHRSLEVKADDRRTRESTRKIFSDMKEVIGQAEQDLKTERTNPFATEKALERIDGSLQTIEELLEMDWFWHELATDSIKSAARTLRSHSSVFEVLKSEEATDSEKHEAASEQAHSLKQQLRDWQMFLEKEHQEWQEAFDGGLDIEIESAVSVRSVQNEEVNANTLREPLKAASEQITALLDWKNELGVPVNRQSGIPFLDEARIALSNGEFEDASQNATVATQRAGTELQHGLSLDRRLRFAREAEMRKAVDELINPSFIYAPQEHEMTCPVTAATCPGNRFGFSRTQTGEKINGHSVANRSALRGPVNGSEKPNRAPTLPVELTGSKVSR